MAIRQMDAVVGDAHYRNNAREEFHLAGGLAVVFLHQALLCFALIGRLFFFGLFELFNQVTAPVAMEPGFVPVLAKFGGNVIPVEFEAGVHHKARKAAAHNAKNKQHGCYPILHGAKVKPCCLFTTEFL
jgi:hypothetical protein